MTISSAVAGAAWTSTNIAGYWRYRAALADPARAQHAVLADYLRANADTAFGRAHGFSVIRSVDEYQARVPLASYSDFSSSIDEISCGAQGVLTRDRVRSLALSSGSVSAAKRIPYTRRLQQEFRRAIAPWVVDLYRGRPELALGCSYWSITPVARDPSPGPGAVPVGFEEDSEYLGATWKRFVDATLAVPGAVRFVRDVDAFRYVTLLCLLRCPDLRLVSVWHPSFLTLLLDALVPHWDSLLDDVRRGTITPPSRLPAAVEQDLQSGHRRNPRRAEALAATGPEDYAAMWPRLQIVSCWADGHAAWAVNDVRRRLPRVHIQPKGLLATEAVVTVPFQELTPLAVRSHFFEFLRDGRTYLAHQLVPGEVYSVVVTTGGGLYRYRLEDKVEVNGFVQRTPSLRFLGKEDCVSDLCGEKLNETFVARALDRACERHGVVPRCALVAPDLSGAVPAYTLYVEADAPPPAALSRVLDEALACNPQYGYCRTLGQLAPVRLFHVTGPMFPLYLDRCRELGQRLGDVKPLALSTRTDWSGVFPGHYLAADGAVLRARARGRRLHGEALSVMPLFGYGHAPVDEMDLTWRSEAAVERLEGVVPNTADLTRLTAEHGLDFATMVFYRAVLASPVHAEFVRRVDGYPAAPRPRHEQPVLLIVPAMFYRERPDLGGDGSLVASIARACGFRVEVIPTVSRGWVSENARVIRAAIERERDAPLWILSLSKGGGEVRVALQGEAGAGPSGRVQGWINVSGIVRGSHFIDHMLETPARRLRARAFCLALGTSYAGAAELKTTHPYWRTPFDPGARMRVINLVGVPLGCHVQKGLAGRYRRLGALGPNDGFVLLPETLIHPGVIYPLWGSDHLFRSPQVSPLLYRLFNLLQDRHESASAIDRSCA